jgi:glycogen debranching enzyme
VALAGAYYERTGDQAFIESIWSNICSVLQWMAIYGDKDGDGFLEYKRSSTEGLIHQGWKDGDDAIFHADGAPAQGSIALGEVQGYAYAAYKAASMLAELLGSHKEAIFFKNQAETLRKRFNDAFWCEELSTYAMALDGTKQRCCVETSNAGQCLFTEIATPERAERVARTLLSSAFIFGMGHTDRCELSIKVQPDVVSQRQYLASRQCTHCFWND